MIVPSFFAPLRRSGWILGACLAAPAPGAVPAAGDPSTSVTIRMETPAAGPSAGASAAAALTADRAPSPPASAAPAPAAPAAVPPAESGRAREVQTLFNLASTYLDRHEYAGAENAFEQILGSDRARPADQRRALLDLAQMYRKQGANTRAVACFEKYLKEFPDDPATPLVYLDLGRTLRSLGAYRLALVRFYSVINTTLKLSEEGYDQYRAIAKTAQFEIAETHFQEGDYEDAGKYYGRLQLLDLAPADRACAQFKSACAEVLAGNAAAAETSLRTFIDQNPDDENVPEARYLLSTALRRLGRDAEAFDAVLDLLRTEKIREASNPRRWAYWQRRTGNEMANAFYETGNYLSALGLYEALAALATSDPTWRLPALYQAGLCCERLGQYDRARGAYDAVTEGCAASMAKVPAAAGLDDLGRMAAWRREHLQWRERTETQVATIFRTLPLPTSDHVGPPARPPTALR